MGLAEQFVKAVQTGDVYQEARFANRYYNVKEHRYVYPSVVMEMSLSLDYGTGVQFEEVLSLLAKAAAGLNVKEEAQGLVKIMGETYESHFVKAATPEEAAREDYEGQTENIYIPSFMS